LILFSLILFKYIIIGSVIPYIAGCDIHDTSGWTVCILFRRAKNDVPEENITVCRVHKFSPAWTCPPKIVPFPIRV
jgi:hypothetical protein